MRLACWRKIARWVGRASSNRAVPASVILTQTEPRLSLLRASIDLALPISAATLGIVQALAGDLGGDGDIALRTRPGTRPFGAISVSLAYFMLDFDSNRSERRRARRKPAGLPAPSANASPSALVMAGRPNPGSRVTVHPRLMAEIRRSGAALRLRVASYEP